MPKWKICVKEMWEQPYEVEADTLDLAMEMIDSFEDDPNVKMLENELCFCNRLPIDTWVTYAVIEE